MNRDLFDCKEFQLQDSHYDKHIYYIALPHLLSIGKHSYHNQINQNHNFLEVYCHKEDIF